MTFKSFFWLIFISSIAISTLFFFFPNESKLLVSNMKIEYKIDNTFVSLVSLITSILSYITLNIYSYIEDKNEKIRLKKLERERINLDKIHEELKAMSIL